MKPLLFPFTVVTPALARTLHQGFGAPALLVAPSPHHLPETTDAASAEGLVEVRFPAGEEERLETVLAAYREWARLHPSDGLLRLAATLESVPFYDESKPSRIRSEILGGRPSPPPTASDRLTAARVFLILAQEADRDALDVQEGLRRVEDQQRSLVENLLGPGGLDEDSAAGDVPSDGGDGAMVQIPQRMRAWSRLALEIGEPPPLWVTTSRSAFDQALDTAPSPAVSLGEMPFPAAREAVVSAADSLWHRLAREPWATSSTEELPGSISEREGPPAPFRLTAALIPDAPPAVLMRRWASAGDGEPADTPGGPWRNTLVACLNSGS